MDTANPPRLFPLAAPTAANMAAQLSALEEDASRAPGELGELAAELAARLPEGAPVRTAVVASSPAELADGAATAQRILGGRGVAIAGRAFAGSGEGLRIGFLFPGQGAPARASAGGAAELLPRIGGVFARVGLGDDHRKVPDELVQLSVVAATVAGLAAMRDLGVEAEVAVGHSLGELAALHWGGAYDERSLLTLARARGEAMTAHASDRGAMATVVAEREAVAELAGETGVGVACVNSSRQCVVSGRAAAVDDFVASARSAGLRAMTLPVIGAFHSPLMQPAQPVFARDLADQRFGRPTRRVVSTVTGTELCPDEDLRSLLVGQLVSPVLFAEALAETAAGLDLLLEVGPGRVLAPMGGDVTDVPIVATRIGDASPRGLLEAAAAAFAAGAPAAQRLAAAAAETGGS